MKRPLAFLLVCIHLAGNTEAGQIFRLPILWKHFQFHHNSDPSLHFIEFLSMHYAGDDGNRSDDEEDAKLPFHDYTHSSVTAVYATMVKTIVNPAPFAFNDNILAKEQMDLIPSTHVTKILQPPRF